MLVLAASLVILGLAQDLPGLQDGEDTTALLAVVVVVAFVAGVCYAFVAVPAQTSLQEELPSRRCAAASSASSTCSSASPPSCPSSSSDPWRTW